jgi:2-methylcitrate dehydratase PrpD
MNEAPDPGDKDGGYGETIARFAASARDRLLPTPVVERAKLHIIDSLAAMVSGSALEAGLAGCRYAVATGGPPAASILGTSARVPLVEAALANGMSAHADESDDSHEDSQTHPGCGVLPAAVVVADESDASGAAFLRAVVLGYEMTVRFATALGSAMTFKRSSLSSHAYGPLFGAGYAAGSLMTFDQERFAVLLNYLAQEASGLTTWRLDQRHTLKSYAFAGMPASNGVKAAALVRSGFTGGGDALDPENRNMLDAICPNPRPDALTDALGVRHAVLETDIKRYPVGYPIASPLAALEKILALRKIHASEVKQIRTYYNEDWYKVIGDESRMPDVNMRYCLAVTLLDGRLTFDAAHDAGRMTSPDVVSIGNKIRMLPPKPHLDRFAVRVELDVDGEVLTAEQDRYVLGRAENPMSRGQVHEKALELMSPIVGNDNAKEAIAMLDDLDRMESVRPLLRRLCKVG